MRLSNLVICLTTVAVATGLWAAINRPVDGENWLGPINGVSFSPYQQGDSAITAEEPTEAEIAADIALLSGKVRRLRTYASTGILGEVPRIAEEYGLKVTAGAWIDKDLQRNQDEVARLIRISLMDGNVDRLIVGNEALLRGDVTVDELTGYIRKVKTLVHDPVSTSEPWHVWLAHPELAREVDFIGVHILPFWEGISSQDSVAFILARYRELQAAFPGKPIVLTEVGWPSNGLTRKEAVASPVDQGMFLRHFLNVAADHGLDYIIVEAFDQPWKADLEGGVGAYWGLFDADRVAKFSFYGPLQNMPDWKNYAGVSAGVGAALILWLLARQPTLRVRGRVFLAVLTQAVVSGAALVWAAYANRYVTLVDASVLGILAPGLLLLFFVVLTEGVEMGESLWSARWRRRLTPAEGAPAPARLPKVSIHVPCYNEPPEMVIDTLKALERLDYPDFEVLVVDNNTKDPAVWLPVKTFCENLGARFRFFHLDPWPGYKAGALNFALHETAPDAEIVATIDSDYVVERGWLKDLVALFEDPKVALVQAPQDYRDAGESLFKRLCFWEYAGFFHLGMHHRNERNAIIQHGTMALIRRSALQQVGGWGEWCITEDAELGLKLFEAGYDAQYVQHSYGRGLMPDSFAAFRKQRFRWAYGAVQIVKHHWRELLAPRRTALDRGQRYHFVAGWLGWVADGLQLLFILAALGWSAGIVLLPQYFEPPLTLFMAATLSLFFFKVVKSLWLYVAKVRCGVLDALGAALAGLALSHTVGKAILYGIFTSRLPFLRTPKCENQPALIRGLAAAHEEIAYLLLLWGGAAAVWLARGEFEPAARLWSLLLVVQSLPYMAALALSLINALPAPRLPRQIGEVVVSAATIDAKPAE
jgi:exo-beta-1,3-glucanase (GH17 family)/cellulose synthase/poly-beta-1,6-N-acetylglucosamine synthase-like glycosyltransferase